MVGRNFSLVPCHLVHKPYLKKFKEKKNWWQKLPYSIHDKK